MQSNNLNAVESPESFCRRISERLSYDGFQLEIQPGHHLVDDAGADSLAVLQYVLVLEELGFHIDLASFDTDLLNTDVAYKQWISDVVGRVISFEANKDKECI